MPFTPPDVRLPPIIEVASPTEAVATDPVLPSVEGDLGAAGGTVARAVGDALPLPVTDQGAPGGLTQLRGLGATAEDVDVEALGVPLDYAQGGGFDFSALPRFLWSGFQYQQGPSLGAFDPRGVAGSVQLMPWTAQAVAHGGAFGARATFLGSTSALSAVAAAPGANAGEVSAAASGGALPGDVGFRWALVGGGELSTAPGSGLGARGGPAAGLSTRWNFGRGVLSFHLLATDVDSATPGPAASYAPLAHQLTARVLPTLQLDERVAGALLKVAVFYDWVFLDYEDPGSGFFAPDHSQQMGAQAALLAGAWRFGASGRQVTYQSGLFSAPPDQVVSAQVSRDFDLGGWLVSPTLRAVGVLATGFAPEASVGARYDATGGLPWAFFSRAGYSRRFASLADRYYADAYFTGNPSLQPENDVTAVAGGEVGGAVVSARLQVYAQFRGQAQVRTATSIANQGDAAVAALEPSAQWRPSVFTGPWGAVELGTSATFAYSRVYAVGQPFPYLPAALVAARAGVRAPFWHASLAAKFASSAASDLSGGVLAAYGYVDLVAGARVGRALDVDLRVENLGGGAIEFVSGYPGPGRVVSLGVTATL